MPGAEAWGSLEPMPGAEAWDRGLDPRPGAEAWRRSLGPMPGAEAWGSKTVTTAQLPAEASSGTWGTSGMMCVSSWVSSERSIRMGAGSARNWSSSESPVVTRRSAEARSPDVFLHSGHFTWPIDICCTRHHSWMQRE